MSKADEAGAMGLARGHVSLAELLDAECVQRGIEKTMAEIVKRSAIPSTASMLPERPSPLPAEPGTGWRDETKIEMPLGQSGQDRIAEICDHFLGPAVKPKKQD